MPKEKITLHNIISFFEGNFRYILYKNRFRNILIRRFIREQINYRLRVMRVSCYSNGSCEVCGCETPALQMATKGCAGDCYPKLLSKSKWKQFKNHQLIVESPGRIWIYNAKEDKHILHLENNYSYVSTKGN